MNRKEAIRLKPGTIVTRYDKYRTPNEVGKVITATKRGGILVERLLPYENLKEMAKEQWTDVTYGKEWWGYIGIFIL